MTMQAEYLKPLDKIAIIGSTSRNIESLDVFATVASTNSFLLEQEISVGRARVCVTEAQPAGRGRRGNHWQSTAGSNILMSLSWGFADWPDTITGLGLATGLVVAERLRQNYQLPIKIKWPNDLLIDDKKLGGILIDVSGVSTDVCNVVIGIGLNVRQEEEPNGTQGAEYAWQDLHSLGVDLNRNTLVAQLIDDCIDMLEIFSDQGFDPFAEHWNRLSSYADRQITVSNQHNSISGRMNGVDNAGALVLESADGETHTFSDSNVSVRLVQ